VKVVFQDTNAKIRPGMSATVDITTAKRDNALSVPYSAVVMRAPEDSTKNAKTGTEASSGGVNAIHAAETTGDTTKAGAEKKELKGVLVIQGGKVKFVPVVTGVADQRNIEIVSGISKQDSVVTGPFRILRTLKDGEAVKIMKTEGEGTDSKGPKA
jgi:HlyD family secretion protein